MTLIKYCAVSLVILFGLSVSSMQSVEANQTVSWPELSGTVVDEKDATPLPGAVISVLWVLQNQNTKSANTPTLFTIKQTHCDASGQFTIPAIKATLPDGMILAPGKAPLLRIYATGYHRLEMPSNDTNQISDTSTPDAIQVAWNTSQLKMQPLAEQGNATLLSVLIKAREQEVQLWRSDVDSVIASSIWKGDLNKGLVAQAELVRLLAKNCLLLPADTRQQICLLQDSSVANYMRIATLKNVARSMLQPSKGPQLSIVVPDPELQPKKIKLIDPELCRLHACTTSPIWHNETSNRRKYADKGFQDCNDCPDMVKIPAGTFTMGSDAGTEKYEAAHKPAHKVSIKSFSMSITPVTQGQWQAVMGTNPSYYNNCGDNCPVESVSWELIHQFIQKLNTKTGKQYRLPSEAEWEYACKAGGKHTYCGSDDANSVGWYSTNSENIPQQVADKLPNVYGLYDMSGNVWELVEDCWHDNYNGAPNDGSAWKTTDCLTRQQLGPNFRLAPGMERFVETRHGVMRGGCAQCDKIQTSSIFRQEFNDNGARLVGFRLVRDKTAAVKK